VQKKVALCVKHAVLVYARKICYAFAMKEQVGIYECIVVAGIFLLLFLYSIGKPLCVACFFDVQNSPSLYGAFQGQGVVVTEPEVAVKYQRFTISIPRQERTMGVSPWENFSKNPAHVMSGAEQIPTPLRAWESIAGQKALVFLNRYIEIGYGDVLKIKGTLKAPINRGTFDYRAYLEQRDIKAIMYYPSVIVVGKITPSRVTRIAYTIKTFLRGPILKNFPEPHAGLILAMTLGDTWRISQEFYTVLAAAGIIHLVSISGLHIAVIFSALFFLFILLGFNRPIATYISLPIIAAYVFLVGYPASAIRSGLMGAIFFFGYIVGRAQRSFYILLLSAFLMLLWDMRWFFDIGFQLSFAALLGLILIYPEMRKLIFPSVDNFIKNIIIGSFAVELTLFPLLGYYFGRISLVSFFVNIIVLPPSAFWLILCLVVEITGFFTKPLLILTDYFIKIIYFFGDNKFSSISFAPFPLWFVLTYYVGLFIVLYLFSDNKRIL